LFGPRIEKNASVGIDIDLNVGDIRYPISDIDICYSDIGEKYVGLKNVIPISTSEIIPISDIEENNI
jgi:hypothetical protein